MSTNWQKPWDFPLPDSNVDMASYMLAYDVRSNIINAGLNFLSPTPDNEFVDPDSYLEAILTSAFSIINTPYTQKYVPSGWSPVKAAFALWNQALDFLKTVPVNAGDPDTLSVYAAWVAKTGYLYGGHLAPPAVSGIAGDGVNVSTGPNSVQGGTILGGTK